MTTSPPHRIAISGLGMISAIGRDVVTSCASARAGLLRISELYDLQLRDPNTEELELAKGHAVVGITEGFAGLGRLVRLGVAGLNDLAAYSRCDDWANTALFINLSSGFLLKAWDEAARAQALEEGEEEESVLPYDMALRDAAYQTWLMPTMLKLANMTIDPANQFVFFGDQAGAIQSLRLAVHGLQTGRFERCIVGGIDSCVEGEYLEAAHDLSVLKTVSRTAGFIPGEGAAFVLLEKEETARRRQGRVEGFIEAPGEQSEAFDRFAEEPAVGLALSSAIAETLGQLADQGQHTGLIIGNLNGDPYRAYDWGHALIRLRVRHPWMDLPEWYPALWFGEVGAASGCAAACLAVRALARGYAGTDNVLVWLANDDGKRGAFYIRKNS